MTLGSHNYTSRHDAETDLWELNVAGLTREQLTLLEATLVAAMNPPVEDTSEGGE